MRQSILHRMQRLRRPANKNVQLQLQVNTVLELFVPFGSVSYTAFKKKFLEVTKKEFEEKDDYSIENMLDNSFFIDHTCIMTYDENHEPIFKFRNRSNLSNDEKIPEIQELPNVVSTINEQKIDGIQSAGSSSSRVTLKFDTEELNNQIHIEHRNKFSEMTCYAYKMFSQPTWKNLSEDSRKKNKQLYAKFLRKLDRNPEKKPYIQKEARDLAETFWAPHIRLFPQVLYLLKQLSIKKPDGFNLTNIGNELEDQIPESWRIVQEDLSFSSLLTDSAQLMDLNLLMQKGGDDIQTVVVNKIIDSIGFHEIRDHEISMIYNYVGSSRNVRSTRSIHEFMCEQFPGWKYDHNAITSMDRIECICLENVKMFSANGNGYSAKQHGYKIAVPMSFSLVVMYNENESI